MAEPAKPFACTIPECGMSFTNEDHLHVHTKKHDMVLQLGLEQKSTFVADQTPTPTRFIRNCEEMGLFQDLQNVAANPFDEGFKRAMEAKHGILSLESAMTTSDDVLHTPQMVFPLLDGGESTLYTNNQRNITISRSSSDESGTIKEFETRTISKLTNEVTTISRIVNADDVTIKQTDIQKDIETVSYKNNVIKIESNVIRKDDKAPSVLVYSDTVAKEASNKNVTIDISKLQVDKVPIMSQKSIDLVVDSFTSELQGNVSQVEEKGKPNDNSIAPPQKNLTPSVINKSMTIKRQPKLLPKKDDIKIEPEDEYEVFIKLPNGKQVRMKPVEEKVDAKQVLRNNLTKKYRQEAVKRISNVNNIKTIVPGPLVPNIVKIPTGTLIPVTLVNQIGTPLTNKDLDKVPITKLSDVIKIPNTVNVATKIVNINTLHNVNVNAETPKVISTVVPVIKNTSDGNLTECFHVNTKAKEVKKEATETLNKKQTYEHDNVVVLTDDEDSCNKNKRRKIDKSCRSAASKRYRDKLKEAMRRQSVENKLLKDSNEKLLKERAMLKSIILEHLKKCSDRNDLIDKLTAVT